MSIKRHGGYDGVCNNNSLGSPSSVSLSYSRSSATLTCTTTGGPATTVTLSKDNIQISPSSSTYQQSQRVMDTTISTYLNLLTISSTNDRDYSGSFSCQVTNDRAGSSLQSVTLSCESNNIIISVILVLISCYQLFKSLETDYSQWEKQLGSHVLFQWWWNLLNCLIYLLVVWW